MFAMSVAMGCFVVVFSISRSSCEFLDNHCLNSITKSGDIMLTGLIDVHYASNECSHLQFYISLCFSLNENYLREMMGMVFSITEINKNSLLMPNITLGYVIYDTCYAISKVIEAGLTIVGSRVKSIRNTNCSSTAGIGPFSSRLSLNLNNMLGLFDIPQVGITSTCKCLSDKKRFPSFVRTVPSDAFQATAIANLVWYFAWHYVGMLSVDDEYGQNGITQVLAETEADGVCIAFHHTLPKVRDKTAYRKLEIVQAKVSVVLLFTTEPDLFPFAEELADRNITGRTWIATEAWVGSLYLKESRFRQTFQGAIGFALQQGNIPGLREFLINLKPEIMISNDGSLDVFLLKLWEVIFNCTWNNENQLTQMCTGQEKLTDVETVFTDTFEIRTTYHIHMAVHAIANALHDLRSCTAGFGPFVNGSCANMSEFSHRQLLYYLRKVRFMNNIGNLVSFDENGDPPAIYEVLNWQPDSTGGLHFQLVGAFDSTAAKDKQLHINTNLVVWNHGGNKIPQSICSDPCKRGTRKILRKGEPFCCFDCIKCKLGEYSNATDSQHCRKCPKYLWSTDQRDSCIIMEEEYIKFPQLLAMTLLAFVSVGCIFTGIVTFIILPNHVLHTIDLDNNTVDVLLLFSLMGCFCSSVTFIGRPTKLTCTARESLACIWLTLVMKCILHKIFQSVSHSQGKDRLYLQGKIIFGIWMTSYCVFSICWCMLGKTRWIICALSYLGLLSVVCFILSLRAQTPSTKTNECKFINFSLSGFILVWLTFIPAYNSTDGKFALATEMFAIIASAYIHLCSIYIPKCYIILRKGIK
uniref:G-protein coupled receptors family 3 profile domain-containing protein n=1 Tax=Eptatretus burgeri TaxID=7764 RepID=A0A8C4QZR8_EPTBU